MINQRFLSGYEIVTKGAAKAEATLPELGLKDLIPNKTWLEDKQVQAAIEARKLLIEVERIDKSGVLSYAEWREDLMLAEVIQAVGSCWQYLGHNVGKKLYLTPEEALFLLETNSLCLKNNDVKVSLQQAYTLLLRDKVTLLQYKVYASLCRVGYRVYRHIPVEVSSGTQKIDSQSVQNDMKAARNKEDSMKPLENTNEKMNDKNDVNHDQSIDSGNMNSTEALHEDMEVKQEVTNEESTNSMQTTQEEYTKHNNQIKHKRVCYLKKLQRLKNRQIKPCNIEILHKYFANVPELLDKNIVNVKAPDKTLLPNTINLTKPVYKVNLLNIQTKEINSRPLSTETNIYSANEEVNGSHIRRLRGNRIESSWIPPTTNTRFATQQNTQYRPSHYWRSRQPFNYYSFNMLFQRPLLPNWYLYPNFNIYSRAQPNFWRPNVYNNRNNYNYRKRSRKFGKNQHLDGILKLAARLKQMMLFGNRQANVYAIQKLIQTYNTKYKTKLRLNESFDVVIDETIVDTITLDDEDEGPSSKRRKLDPAFVDNLNNLKTFALKLKVLEHKDKCSGKHRRAFSKLLKTFNEAYKEDYYLNEDNEIACRNQIDLNTSVSNSDDPDETPIVIGKKLKNPFNVLKRLSETQNSLSTEVTPHSNNDLVTVNNNKYSDLTLNTFTKGWLPGEDDFGRADIISKDACSNEVTDIGRDEFLYDFIKMQTCKYNNWLDLKKSFFNSIQAAIVEFQDNMPTTAKMELNSIVSPEDYVDMASVFKKLSIIKSNKNMTDECNLTIDFDVYNRDIQNFRKSNRPTPHFRVICVCESTILPHREEIAVLHSKYADQVNIVFAVVGIDSISYVQINPTDLPVLTSDLLELKHLNWTSRSRL